jgi:hypothetical protein
MSWETVRRAVASRVLWTGLAVDLAPVLAVLFLGWNAAAVVMLYWIENLIIGVLILPRIFLSGSRLGLSGSIGGALGAGFFALHYSLFCALHGTLLLALLSVAFRAPGGEQGVAGLTDALTYAFAVGPQMIWFIGLVAVWRAWAMVWRYIRFREWRESELVGEMFAPYPPILILHSALLFGVLVIAIAGAPAWSALVLVGLRVVWGLWVNIPRDPPPTDDEPPEPFPHPGP